MRNVFKFFLRALIEQYYFFSYPIVSLFIKHKPDKNSKIKGTIVFVECWFQKNPYHKRWSSYLEDNGFRVIPVSFSDMNEPFEKSAEKLHEHLKNMDLKDYVLVGISGGAIVCLYYLNHYKKWEDVKRFISLAGPLRGTPLAWAIAFTKKGRELIPESKFLQKIAIKDIPKNKMVTLSPEKDELVPIENSTLPGIPSYKLPIHGHNVFHLGNRETYDMIIKLSE